MAAPFLKELVAGSRNFYNEWMKNSNTIPLVYRCSADQTQVRIPEIKTATLICCLSV